MNSFKLLLDSDTQEIDAEVRFVTKERKFIEESARARSNDKTIGTPATETCYVWRASLGFYFDHFLLLFAFLKNFDLGRIEGMVTIGRLGIDRKTTRWLRIK